MLNYIIALFLLCCCIFAPTHCLAKPFASAKKAEKAPPKENKVKDFAYYADFFEEVFNMFKDHYYLSPDRKVYDDFIEKFKIKIYPQLSAEGKSTDYVRWRSAWYLVDSLKSKEDRFSQFYPPKPAEKFQKEAMGQRVDLGIEAKEHDLGYVVSRIEPRSDAYEKGLREEDILISLDDKPLKGIASADVEKMLSPLINTDVKINYIQHEKNTPLEITVTSKEYFKQTVFLKPTSVERVFCLEIPKFNRTSGEDLLRFLQLIRPYQPKGLVIDLRGNPGGPPLAAREMAGFFLTGGEEFAHFKKRDQEPDALDVPTYDPALKVDAPIVVLVNEESGSASELFAGILQFRKRATVLGTNTAGQVLLKTMFPFKDGSMVGLVTAPGYFPDGTQFSFSGITPDQIITDAPKDGLINLAAAFLAYKNHEGPNPLP